MFVLTTTIKMTAGSPLAPGDDVNASFFFIIQVVKGFWLVSDILVCTLGTEEWHTYKYLTLM